MAVLVNMGQHLDKHRDFGSAAMHDWEQLEPQYLSVLSEFESLPGHVSGGASRVDAPDDRFVKLPNNFAGIFLDRGRASAYAIHLAVLRLAHGSGYVLNERNCEFRYGMGRRGFRQGVKLLRSAGLLDRDKNGGKASDQGRRFASERWLIAPSDGFVRVPRDLLAKDSFVISFYVAATLSTAARTPLEVAKRIGVTSPKTIQPYIRLLDGLIAISRPPGGSIRIARGGHQFEEISGSVKTSQANACQANPCRHTGEVRQPLEKLGSSPREGKLLGQGTLANANALAQEFPARPPMPEYLSLSPWRSSYERATSNRHFVDLEPGSLAPNEELLSPQKWHALLQKFGGAPAHVATPNALKQATEIAFMLAEDESEISRYQALQGVALAICRAFAQGRSIRSLGFIATMLARLVTEQDRSWALDYPPRLSEADDEEARRLVEWGLGRLKARGLDHDSEQLRGTASREHLWVLVKKYGFEAVQVAVENGAGAGEGYTAWSWSLFAEAVQAIPRTKRKAAIR